MRFNPKKINLDQRGTAKVLGTLEAGIMEIVWKGGPLTVREVMDLLPGRKKHSFNTIMTVMNRLVEKEVLAKRAREGSNTYAATVARDAFFADVSRSVFSALLADPATFQLAAFVEALEGASAEDVRTLKRIIDGKLG
jgi:predicted transcriptional regulator